MIYVDDEGRPLPSCFFEAFDDEINAIRAQTFEPNMRLIVDFLSRE